MTSANPHLRGIAIAGALALAAVGLGMMTLTRQQPSSQAAVSDIVVHTLPSVAKAKPKPAAPAKHVRVAKPKPVAIKPLDTVFAKAALAAGLPKHVAEAFASHEVAVVTLYTPHADVDEVAQAEARAGAALAGAGYVAVDASHDGTTGLLTKAFGVLSSPTTLVLSRADFAAPRAKMNGFADRETVAQAALNADPTPGGPAAQTPWARQAQALCAHARQDYAELGPITSSAAKLEAATPQVRTIGGALVAALGKLTPPAGQEADTQKFVSLAQQDLDLKLQVAAAATSHDRVALATASASETTIGAQADALAVTLGAPDCAETL